MLAARHVSGGSFRRLGERRGLGAGLGAGRGGARREADLTSLINIVFLILIFFVVAGALRPFAAKDIELAKVARGAVDAVSPSTLIVYSDGRIRYRGRVVEVAELGALVAAHASRREGGGGVAGALDGASGRGAMTIVADGRLPARRLIEVSGALRAAGIESMALMAERVGS